jgi:hemerythrin superfamily protein
MARRKPIPVMYGRHQSLALVAHFFFQKLLGGAKMLKVKAIAQDAVALLEADHAQVKIWFSQFEKAKAKSEQQDLATNICNALKVHMEIEEEIFYPAFLAATQDRNTYAEAISEHRQVKKIIDEVARLSPSHAYFHTRVNVLAQMIKRHIKEEERPGGMFDEARRSKLADLNVLGEELAMRKQQLEAKPGDDALEGGWPRKLSESGAMDTLSS